MIRTRLNKMAEGEEQVSGRRGELIKNCSPCSTKDTERSAVKFCFMCETFFCQECTDKHNELLTNHRVTEIESVEVGEILTSQTGSCPQHGKALNLYCKQDDKIGCDICISREHSSCEGVVYLPTSVQEVLKDIDVSEVKKKLRTAIDHLKSIKVNQQETLTSLQADKEKCLEEINDHNTELLELLQKSVQSSKDQVEETFERLSSNIQSRHKEVGKCLSDLESSEKRLERNQGNDIPLFVELKKCKDQLKATEHVSRDSLENLNVISFSVKVDERLHILLSELESLVTVLDHVPVKVKKTIIVSVKEDKQTCRILGSCVISDSSILLSDIDNKMLKRVDQNSLKVIDKCIMQNAPIDVCVINKNEVAVTQQNKTVVIVSVRPRLTPTRTISMNHHCAYAAYSQGELFITDEQKSLYIYNMEGSLLKKVSTDPSGQDMFSGARHVVASATGDKIYIADDNNGVIILDREGRLQNKLVNKKIRGAFSLCLDGMGGLFVGEFNSKTVVHVTATGQKLTEVLTRSDGLSWPMSVCYDRLRNRLIVTRLRSNTIRVCELE